ncbi:MAG: hypothetical protein WC700_12920 [Gemmatimonadaceae bacterium]|jgi:hypothetical protein
MADRGTLSPGGRRRLFLRVIAVGFAGVPVMFGLIRAISTGSDVRYLWLAGAALVGSAAVMVVKPDTTEPGRVSVGRALGAVAAGAVCATAASLLQGARAGPGVAIVAIGFGFCTGASAVLAFLARR